MAGRDFGTPFTVPRPRPVYKVLAPSGAAIQALLHTDMLKSLRTLIGKAETPRKANKAVRAGRKPAAAQDYRAIAVVPGAPSCEAARAVAGKRHLFREGLRLPLPGCPTPASCGCRFQKSPDRRGIDRRQPRAAPGSGKFTGPEKRKGKARRSD